MADSPFQFPVAGEPVRRTLARLRDLGPVVRIELPGGVPAWAVNGHDAIAELLAHDNKLVTRNPRHWAALQNGGVPADWPMRPLVTGEHLQVLDGADHRRLRTLLSRAFTPSRVEALTPRIEALVAEHIDGLLAAGGTADLVPGFTEPLPISVICELYGVPTAELHQFRGWVSTLIAHTTTGEQAAAANQDMLGYLAELVDRKRREPGDDLTSGLVRVRDEDDALSDAELVTNLWLMILAGHETTVHLLGQAIVALLTHPEQRALAVEGDRWPDVVEETLRNRTPVTASPFRYAMTDLTLAGMPVPAGDAFLTCYGGMGTDPDRYGAEAERFDITRENPAHQAFGYGPHFCIGAPLARLEGRIALSALFNRLPELRLAVDADDIPYSPSFITHGPLSIPVELRAKAAVPG
ncbi:cytochrome P450 family protein [Spirillospora sp. NBC_01491]|uniref:cytochrome P450 family protein n=1 Tax=Spirillospora sp. NBC_01491 TaxID=2976007 RepID=UPI002E37F659|nr:cytochrome P450 [Spirillospora sp. NBC_01491]